MNEDLSRDAADRFHSAAIHALRQVAREDAASGLSAARLSALSVLVFGGAKTLGELAAAEQVRPPTITRIVTGLEAAGLVVREADPEDGRVVRVHASPKGRRVLQRARERRIAKLAQRLSHLDSKQIALIREAADLVEVALRRSSVPVPARPARGGESAGSRA
jgi:DNA-binding MarR family transcriptional regulator